MEGELPASPSILYERQRLAAVLVRPLVCVGPVEHRDAAV